MNCAHFRMLGVAVAALLSLQQTSVWGADYYVSAAVGKGKKATLEKPAKDLGNIIKKLEPGDVIHIAGGTYLGRGSNGSDVITVPVSIIGGYSDDFSERDPWGKYRTVLSGDNMSKNWQRTPRLMIDLMKYKGKEMPPIMIDGVIIDDAERNRYTDATEQQIARTANPKTQQNSSPDQGGLVVRVSKTGNFDADAYWDITVQNCVVMNSGPTQGALSVSGYKNSRIHIRNNIVINNTGSGIFAGTKFRPNDDAERPFFKIENNTVLFTWKYDPSAQSYSGNAIKFDPDIDAEVQHNVLSFSDRFGVHNAGNSAISLNHNLIAGSVEADYLEFDTRMQLDELEDEAEYLEEAEGNSKEPLQVAVSAQWAKLYGSRVLVDRNAAEADIQIQQTAANEIRAMLGLPLQAGTVDMPNSPVWLPRLSIDDAINAGSQPHLESYGSSRTYLGES